MVILLMSMEQQFHDFLENHGSQIGDDESSLRSESYTLFVKKNTPRDNVDDMSSETSELRLSVDRYITDKGEGEHESTSQPDQDTDDTVSTLADKPPLELKAIPKLKPAKLVQDFSLPMESVTSLSNSTKTDTDTHSDSERSEATSKKQHTDRIQTIMGGGGISQPQQLALPSWVSNRSHKYRRQRGGFVRAGSSPSSYYCNSQPGNYSDSTSESVSLTPPTTSHVTGETLTAESQVGGFIRSGSNQQSYYCNSDINSEIISDPTLTSLGDTTSMSESHHSLAESQHGGFVRAGSNQQSYYCNSEPSSIVSDSASVYSGNSTVKSLPIGHADQGNQNHFLTHHGGATSLQYKNIRDYSSLSRDNDDITSLSSVEVNSEDESIIDNSPPYLGKSF